MSLWTHWTCRRSFALRVGAKESKRHHSPWAALLGGCTLHMYNSLGLRTCFQSAAVPTPPKSRCETNTHIRFCVDVCMYLCTSNTTEQPPCHENNFSRLERWSASRKHVIVVAYACCLQPPARTPSVTLWGEGSENNDRRVRLFFVSCVTCACTGTVCFCRPPCIVLGNSSCLRGYFAPPLASVPTCCLSSLRSGAAAVVAASLQVCAPTGGARVGVGTWVPPSCMVGTCMRLLLCTIVFAVSWFADRPLIFASHLVDGAPWC